VSYLERIKALNVGPIPHLNRKSGWLSHLAGAVDNIGFRALRRYFSAAQRRELSTPRGPHSLEDGWIARARGDLSALYPLPAPPAMERQRIARLPREGVLEQLTFSARDYGNGRDRAKRMLERYPKNRLAHARLYRHREPRPAIIWASRLGHGLRQKRAAGRARALALRSRARRLPLHDALPRPAAPQRRALCWRGLSE
jgi:hypothetical protein